MMIYLWLAGICLIGVVLLGAAGFYGASNMSEFDDPLM